MSVKQDRTYARTAQDIERKYSFRKSFAEMAGVINENRDRVDSVESTISDKMTEATTTLKRDAEQIFAEATKEIADDVSRLSSEVELKLDAEAVNIVVERELSKGVDRVETKTGYKFDADGLNITKSGTEMSNLVDNTGVYVKKSGGNVLVANYEGVEATDLHAKTYLKVGAGEGRSRLEDYLADRTGLFWIGG